jgi:hypothetical protein
VLCCLAVDFLPQNAAGEYKYSGMHDSGPLVKPIEGGIVAALIGAVETAKAYNDEYLTSVIEAEKSTLPLPISPQKRAKRDEIEPKD